MNTPTSNGTRELLVQTIIKQGAWAIVAVGLLLFFGWQLEKFLSVTGMSVTTYVTTSTEATIQLQAAYKDLVKSRSEMQQLIVQNSGMIAANTDLLKANGILIADSQALGKKIVLLIEDAQLTMKDVPKQREEMIAILNQILVETKQRAEVDDHP